MHAIIRIQRPRNAVSVVVMTIIRQPFDASGWRFKHDVVLVAVAVSTAVWEMCNG